jgi:hypothetical protein
VWAIGAGVAVCARRGRGVCPLPTFVAVWPVIARPVVPVSMLHVGASENTPAPASQYVMGATVSGRLLRLPGVRIHVHGPLPPCFRRCFHVSALVFHSSMLISVGQGYKNLVGLAPQACRVRVSQGEGEGPPPDATVTDPPNTPSSLPPSPPVRRHKGS